MTLMTLYGETQKGWSTKGGTCVCVLAVCGGRGEGGLGVWDWDQGQCASCYGRGMAWD